MTQKQYANTLLTCVQCTVHSMIQSHGHNQQIIITDAGPFCRKTIQPRKHTKHCLLCKKVDTTTFIIGLIISGIAIKHEQDKAHLEMQSLSDAIVSICPPLNWRLWQYSRSSSFFSIN